MVQVLPYVAGFGERIGPHIAEFAGQIGQGLQKRSTMSAFKQFDQSVNPQAPPNSPVGQMNAQAAAQQQQELSPIQLAQGAALAANALGKEGGEAYTKELLSRQEFGRKAALKREGQYYQKNEPELIKLGEQQRNLEKEAVRFERLDELFKNEKAFPPAGLAAALSHEGQINAFGQAFLSPDAQEAIKLIVDQTTDIKDSYGARVTNFDLQTYLKRLPSLLNTTEGKQRVLRDLQLMNKLNQLHATGMLEIFDEYGGPGALPFSKAERIFDKKYKDEINEIKKEFVNPTQKTYKSLNDANPSKFMGKKIQDEETGEIFVSDGKSWVPLRQEQSTQSAQGVQ